MEEVANATFVTTVHIERSSRALLAIYREANRKTRTTSAPKYFTKPYNMDRIVYVGTDKDETVTSSTASVIDCWVARLKYPNSKTHVLASENECGRSAKPVRHLDAHLVEPIHAVGALLALTAPPPKARRWPRVA
jgi:hypothetical protein